MFFCLILPSLASLHFLSLIWCGYKLSDLSPFGKIILFLSVVFIHIYLLFTHIYNIYIYGFSLSLQPHMLHGLLETRGMSVAICLCRLAPPHIHAQGITRHWGLKVHEDYQLEDARYITIYNVCICMFLCSYMSSTYSQNYQAWSGHWRRFSWYHLSSIHQR